MKKFNALLSLNMIFLLIVSGQAGRSEPDSKVLRATIQLSGHLPALNKNLTPGAKLKLAVLESMAPKAGAPGIWFKAPDWLVGTWRSYSLEVKKHISSEGLKGSERGVFQDARSFKIGSQRDRRGAVWEWVRDSQLVKTEFDGETLFTLIVGHALDEVSSLQVVSRYFTIDVRVDKKTGTITKIDRTESLCTDSPLPEGELSEELQARYFDAKGNPAFTQVAEVKLRRIKGFVQIDNENGRDLKKMFANYLLQNGHRDLVPDEPVHLIPPEGTTTKVH